MNEELQNALAAMLAKTTSAAEAGVSFLQAELPEVIRQLLLWKAVESAFLCAALILIAVMLFRISRSLWAKHGECEYAGYDIGAGFAIIGALTSLAAAIGTNSWLQIWIAPKVYLIEYAASLAK